MPYFTLLPDTFIDLTVLNPVLIENNQMLLNDLSGSLDFLRYDVDSFMATVLQRGDGLALIDEASDTVKAGKYVGTITYSTTEININQGPAVVTLEINPITAQAFIDGVNQVYLVTDQPLDKDHISVTLSVSALGKELISADIPVSQVDETLLGLPTIIGLDPGKLADTVQRALDTVTINLDYNRDGTFPLSDQDVVPCFARGTKIITSRGNVPIEDIAVGDLVLTKDRGLRAVTWIGSIRLRDKDLRRRPQMRPVRIKAGSLSQDNPTTDLIVSPQHRIILRSNAVMEIFGCDEVLVRAKHLIGMDGVDHANDIEEIEYFHFLCDRHEIVFANYAATESMYAGRYALKAVGETARVNILKLFPAIEKPDSAWIPVRPFATGRKLRQILKRHNRVTDCLVN